MCCGFFDPPHTRWHNMNYFIVHVRAVCSWVNCTFHAQLKHSSHLFKAWFSGRDLASLKCCGFFDPPHTRWHNMNYFIVHVHAVCSWVNCTFHAQLKHSSHLFKARFSGRDLASLKCVWLLWSAPHKVTQVIMHVHCMCIQICECLLMITAKKQSPSKCFAVGAHLPYVATTCTKLGAICNHYLTESTESTCSNYWNSVCW